NMRSLAPDELEWFIGAHYSFLGHHYPRGLAHRGFTRLRDIDHEADKCFVLFAADKRPLAGVYVLAPDPNDDDQNLYLSNFWYTDAAADLTVLLRHVLELHPHEAAHCPLFTASADQVRDLSAAFEPLAFQLEQAHKLIFDLADLPPVGMPVVLEAWTLEADDLFTDVYEAAEQTKPSDRRWAYFKRHRGKFTPDLWFIARETLDQDPIGYAFFGLHHREGVYLEGIDGSYYITVVGVLAQYRGSTQMLRRLLLTSMQELASRSPLGRIETVLSEADPKLIHIFESLGFAASETYPTFVKIPL
ncbi:MAG: hypothetical protein AAF708_07330, partial [Deinococcota bacterium]